MQGFGLQGRDLQGLGQRRLRVYGFAAQGIFQKAPFGKTKVPRELSTCCP